MPAAKATEPTTPEPGSAEWIEAKRALLAAPFPADQIERLPKALRRDDQDKGRCERARTGVCADEHPCGGWHVKSIHLSYVGHAGVTMRLNEVDPLWNWEPMALTEAGTPLFSDGGLWIRLEVLGISRLGYGDASGKSGPSAVKEIIGDAIRNAAMRFGVATYLWSKSEAARVIEAGGDPTGDPAPEPRNRQEPRAERPVHNVQRVHAAVTPLNADGRARLRAYAAESFGADLPPADMNDHQADLVVEWAAYLADTGTLPGDEPTDPAPPADDQATPDPS